MSEASPAGDQVQLIRIIDTGLGIPPDALASIFDLFTQVWPDSSVRHGGMGIGLALARSLAELHGGGLVARSAGAGQGSEFTLQIPVGLAATNEAAPAGHEEVDGLSGLRILIVDDNVDAADAVAMLLSMRGSITRTVYDASTIIDDVAEFDPEVIILDIGLPGINGYEACRMIRGAKGKDVRIIALTGWGQEEDRRLSIESGFDAHLTKPVDFGQLAAVAAAHPRAAKARQR